MREAELLSKDVSGRDQVLLERLRMRARNIAKGSLDAPIWGANRNRVFIWLESIMQDIHAAPRRVPHALPLVLGCVQ